MTRKFLLTLGAFVALGALHACGSEKAFAPTAALTRGSTVGVTHDLNDTAIDTVAPLQWSSFLAQDVTESAVIGPEGGAIRIDEAGASIVFPPGALPRDTRITMTAKAGWNVAYEFCPHGIEFAQAVTVVQDLKYTAASRPKDAIKVQAGYYRANLNGIFVDPAKSLARVSELRHVVLDSPLNPRVAKFYIYHFSGYILSSGFAGGTGDTPSDSLP